MLTLLFITMMMPSHAHSKDGFETYAAKVKQKMALMKTKLNKQRNTEKRSSRYNQLVALIKRQNLERQRLKQRHKREENVMLQRHQEELGTAQKRLNLAYSSYRKKKRNS